MYYTENLCEKIRYRIRQTFNKQTLTKEVKIGRKEKKTRFTSFPSSTAASTSSASGLTTLTVGGGPPFFQRQQIQINIKNMIRTAPPTTPMIQYFKSSMVDVEGGNSGSGARTI